MVLKQKINAALDQLTLYYQGEGAAPTVDLSDLAAQAQDAGVSLPADSDLSKPIKLTPDSTAQHPAKSFADTRAATIITSILLALVLAAISWQRHRYEALPNVLISVGVIIGLLALALHTVPNLVDNHIKLSASSNVFASLGRDLAENIVRDLARRLGVIAGVCLLVGIAARIGAAKLQRKLKQLPPVKITASALPAK